MDDSNKIINKIFTIPNLISLFRLVLIPFIVYCYINEYFILSLILIVISGLSDVVDGFIARHFNQKSKLGIILDPIADKLTQLSIIICLMMKFKLLILVVLIFVIKEIIMSIYGLYLLKHGIINSAKWYGKLNTVLLYITLFILILLPNINIIVANILILCNLFLILFSLVKYLIFYHKLIKKH